jgi:hypothetical protein
MSEVVSTFKELISLKNRFKGKNLSLHGISFEQLQGNVQTKMNTHGIDFKDIREYAEGDDIRRIDWKKTAKLNQPHTKVFSENKITSIAFVLDLRPNMFFGSDVEFKSVRAIKTFAYLVWAAHMERNIIDLYVITKDKIERFENLSNRKNLYAAFKFIARISSEVPRNLDYNFGLLSVLDRLKKNKKVTKNILIISDFNEFKIDADLFEGLKKEIKFFKRKSHFLIIHIYDMLEEELSLNGKFSVSDGKEIMNISFKGDLKKSILEKSLKFWDGFKKFVYKNRISYVSISNKDDLELIISKKFLNKK